MQSGGMDGPAFFRGLPTMSMNLTGQPFLLEGAEKLLSLGTRLGKFWFTPDGIARGYPFQSRWGAYKTLLDLAKSDYFERLFALPFSTFVLEAHTPAENGWKQEQSAHFYEGVSEEFHDLTAHLYRAHSSRSVTFILQHWEGDWLLRGRGGERWNPPPDDWPTLCRRMQKWLAARQAGVTRARREHGENTACRVAHAAEVNRVTDGWKGIPTMTRHVLPEVELDLVSYSAYDGLRDGLALWRCLEEIRKHARTGPLFGRQAVYVGEIGLPENEQPARITERWDEWMGVTLAANVPFVAQWELYCNEFNPKLKPAPHAPVKVPNAVRGFWLVRPDGSLSETGHYFQELWRRATNG
jgi:hypothetical protein